MNKATIEDVCDDLIKYANKGEWQATSILQKEAELAAKACKIMYATLKKLPDLHEYNQAQYCLNVLGDVDKLVTKLQQETL